MNDVAVLVATSSVPQNVSLGIKGRVAASFLWVNGVEPKASAEAAPLIAGQEQIHGTGNVCAGISVETPKILMSPTQEREKTGQ